MHELSSFLFFIFPMCILVILYIRMGLRIRQTSGIQRNLPRNQNNGNQGSRAVNNTDPFNHYMASLPSCVPPCPLTPAVNTELVEHATKVRPPLIELRQCVSCHEVLKKEPGKGPQKTTDEEEHNVTLGGCLLSSHDLSIFCCFTTFPINLSDQCHESLRSTHY